MGESKRESERECDGEEGENNSASRRRRKGSNFVVESKAFEIVVDERKGKPQVLIMEKKGGVSSWVRLGPESLGFFIKRPNPLHQRREKSKMGKGMEGKWEIVFHDARDK
ncbi:hypothetical protein CK203_047536 [Vitis vinifera]|uniref:Uncharacterized protein n=1 Tax=Vitis vinifera TaxID=29760 RepID=A0A438GWX7_VITVI|nr:hypothetical protein CK203_047536 [Vitis vinifera]